DDQRDQDDAKQRERNREIQRSGSPVRDTARAPCVPSYAGPGEESGRTTPEPGTMVPRSITGTMRVTSRRKHASTSAAWPSVLSRLAPRAGTRIPLGGWAW